LNKAVNNM